MSALVSTAWSHPLVPDNALHNLIEECAIAAAIIPAVLVAIDHLDDDGRLSGGLFGDERNLHVHIVGKGRVLGRHLLAPDPDLIHRPREHGLVVHKKSLIARGVGMIRVAQALDGHFGQDTETSRPTTQYAPPQTVPVLRRW